MKGTAKFFGLFSDETRLRMLMLLDGRELFVCQIMAVMGISQPLASRNLALMDSAGLLEERRRGKQIFCRLKRPLPWPANRVMSVLKENLADDPVVRADMENLAACREFLKKTGKCDMKTFLAYMEKRRMERRRRL